MNSNCSQNLSEKVILCCAWGQNKRRRRLSRQGWHRRQDWLQDCEKIVWNVFVCFLLFTGTLKGHLIWFSTRKLPFQREHTLMIRIKIKTKTKKTSRLTSWLWETVIVLMCHRVHFNGFMDTGGYPRYIRLLRLENFVAQVYCVYFAFSLLRIWKQWRLFFFFQIQVQQVKHDSTFA